MALNESSSDRSIFPFFKLARELRDQIYDECLEHRMKQRQCHCRVHVQHAARVDLLLVSRQFGSEYKQSAMEKMCVTIVDCLYYDLSLAYVEIGIPPTVLSELRFIRLDLGCYGRRSTLKQLTCHRKDVNDLIMPLRALQVLSIRVTFEDTITVLLQLISELNRDDWLSLFGLESLEVYCRPYDRRFIFAEVDQHCTLVAKLSATTGKVEAVEE